MNRDIATQSMGVSILGMLTGFVLLFFSVNFGQYRAERWLTARGSASTEEYVVIVEQSISVFIVLGGVLLAASLLWAIMLFVKYPDMFQTQPREIELHEKE